MMDTRVSDRPIETDTAIRQETRYFSTMRYYFLRQTLNVGVRRQTGVWDFSVHTHAIFFFTKVAKSLESWTIFIPPKRKMYNGNMEYSSFGFILTAPV